MNKKHADVLIVPGQGIYVAQTGDYVSEYPDGDVYLGHAMSVKKIVENWHYLHIICSGGHTQKNNRTLSEACCFRDMWSDTASWPLQSDYIYYDEQALDSAQNVLLGLMEARCQLAETPIRRIGVIAAWKFKKQRFNRIARDMGFLTRFYFHGYASAEEADAGQMALEGEVEQLGILAHDNDSLMLHERWEWKRRKRFTGELPNEKDPEDGSEYRNQIYPDRLQRLQTIFPDTFHALEAIRISVAQAVQPNYKPLQSAVTAEILK